MAREGMIGFETGDIRSEMLNSVGTAIVGTGVTFDTGTVRTGTYALKVVAPSGATGYAPCGSTNNFGRIYVRVTVRPATTARMFFGASGSLHLRINPDGTVAMYDSSTLIGTSSVALTDTTKWYRIEFRTKSGSSVPVLRIDGVDQVTSSPSGATFVFQYGALDTVADTFTIYYDDVAADDTDFPGDGKVVLLVPISQNGTTAALWVDNDGTQTNMYLGAANLPPVGVAAATSPSHKYIKHKGNAAGTTDKHDADMTTYASAGLNSGDIVNAVSAWISTGEEVATGTKLISFEVLSNPVISSSGSLDVYPTSGAQGTWPTNWRIQSRILNSAPGSPTLGTSPVMRVVRPETASRVASVCAMYMYVDYTPAAAKAPPLWINPIYRQMMARSA